ncbi:MAG: hypothetical protein ABFS86_03710 [Planctomycetota bacterium]
MRRKIEWTEKIERGVKLMVRVTFPGKGQVQWRFKRSDEDAPDPDRRPTAEDWDALEEKLEGLYNRRRAPFETLELVRRRKNESGAE